MKKIYFLFCFVFISITSNAQDPFVTTWEVTAGDLDIALLQGIPIPITGYNFTIDFGDGTVMTNVTEEIVYNYAAPGIYTVSISGDFPRFNVASFTAEKLLSVEQWGDIEWESMKDAFYLCSNLVINATDTPDLSQVTSLSGMFRGCSNFNQSINNWDVSTITNMESMFYSCFNYNQPLDNWNTSNVTNTRRMFEFATNFNQPLDSWDMSNVTDMFYMFREASSFNQNINNWDVSNVIDMNRMFGNAIAFNQPLNNWDVSSVQDLNYMFSGATAFNQPLNNWTFSATDSLIYLFENAHAFNQSLNDWDVSNIVEMSGMFRSAISFNQPLSNWNVSSVNYFENMFLGATAFNRPLNSWDMSSAILTYNMFNQATAFNQPLDNWNMSNVEDVFFMFSNATSFNQSLGNWDLSNVTIFEHFVSDSGLDVLNYDNLLQNLATLTIQIFDFDPNGLEYCNSTARDYLINNLGWNIVGDSLSEDCNVISGTITFDADNDGCTATDILSNNLFVQADSGSFVFSGLVGEDGDYSFSVSGDVFTVSVVGLPEYFTSTPESVMIDFMTNSEEIVDFCLTANQSVNDLNITLLPVSDARPGFEAEYQLVIQNVGTQTINAINASLVFDELKQSFITATPSPTTTTSNSLSFTISSLEAFQSESIMITMQTFTPPTVDADDVLSFTASVFPDTDDFTTDDNTFTLDQIVVNSFDPNDKIVLQGDEIGFDDVDNYLDYIIRFQNTGTASAINVRIADQLHPNLDWSTLRITNASHNYTVNVTNGNEVDFIFDNINLPDQATNETESNGFIAYKIKPKSAAQIGDVMSGNASIFFDFNPPIVTNTVSTTIVESLSVEEFSGSNIVSVFPNPSHKGFHLKLESDINLQSAELFNIQGSKIMNISKSASYITTDNLEAEIYLLVIKTDTTTITKKLIKH